MFESHAQNLEDVVLWRALGDIENGTYVDVGAADPDHDSVTKAFYERGWSGVNVEPAPDHASRLAAERPRDVLVQECAGEADGSIVLHHVVGTGLSSVVDDSVEDLGSTSYEVIDVEVPVRRLDDMLRSVGIEPRQPIHFLKIDVEGFEESVIRGIDLTTWRPWVIVAESTKPRSIEQVHGTWEPLLLDNGYEFCLFDGLNRFYVAAEHSDLRATLGFPAGVFDHPFLTPPHAALMREYENLQAGYGRLHVIYDDTIGSYSRLEEETARLEQETASLEEETSRWREEVEQLRIERDAARHQLEVVLESFSWRVTRPLRAVRRKVGD